MSPATSASSYLLGRMPSAPLTLLTYASKFLYTPAVAGVMSSINSFVVGWRPALNLFSFFARGWWSSPLHLYSNPISLACP